MKQWEELTVWEKNYIDSNLTGWKFISFFIPWLWQIWSKRWWLFRWQLWFFIWLRYLLTPSRQSGKTIPWPWMIIIWWIINIVLTLNNFTEEAYKSDMPYFQKYLDAYAKMNGANNNSGVVDSGDDVEVDACRVKYICAKCKETIGANDKECPHCWRIIQNDNSDLNKRSSTPKYDKYWFDQNGYNREWYNAYGYDKDWFNRDWYNDLWYDKNGFDREWYNAYGYGKDWFKKDWYDRQWFDKDWFNRDWYDRAWYNKEWYKKDWYDKRWVDRDWYDRAWYDKDWYDKDWYDDEWYDKDGYNRNWINKFWEKKVNKKRSTKKKLSKPKKANK